MDRRADDDPVLAELRALRQGRGLAGGRLLGAGAVLSALGTSDPDEGLQRLLGALNELGEGQRQHALAVDYGIDLERHLGRAPSTRERDWLGERRQAYAQAVKRDVETVTRWSDATLADLRVSLITDTFSGHLYVVAAVDDLRIAGISVIREPLSGADGTVVERDSMELANTSTGPSLPALVYAFPRDWRPASVRLAVVFRSGRRPTHIDAFFTRSLVQLPFVENRRTLAMQDDTATAEFRPPRREWLYGITWRYMEPDYAAGQEAVEPGAAVKRRHDRTAEQ